MTNLAIGDIVTRKSYGGDIYFKIVDITYDKNQEPVYVLKGLVHRLNADSQGMDLQKHEEKSTIRKIQQDLANEKRSIARPRYRFPLFIRFRARAGRILHLDADGSFLNTCLRYYEEAGIQAIGKTISESEQPGYVKSLLERYQPDILVATGHDSIKKSSGNLYTLDNYRNSRYFVETVKIARSYQPDNEKLFIFAGACQSYYEAIINAGANFASSPGRVFINALDPAYVSEKVALTDSRAYVTPQEVAKITKSGKDGIWGNKVRGHLLQS